MVMQRLFSDNMQDYTEKVRESEIGQKKSNGWKDLGAHSWFVFLRLSLEAAGAQWTSLRNFNAVAKNMLLSESLYFINVGFLPATVASDQTHLNQQRIPIFFHT